MFKLYLAASCLTLSYLCADTKTPSSSHDEFFVLFENEYETSKKETTVSVNKSIATSPQESLQTQTNQDPPSLAAVTTTQAHRPYGQNHYFVYGDFLYWQPFCNDLTWGYLIQNPSAGSYTEQYRFAFNWNVGFRLGFQFTTSWQTIDLDANWTNFHNNSKTTKQNTNILRSSSSSTQNYGLQGDSDSVFNRNPTPPGFSLPLGWKITASYTMDFDQYDFTIKKNCQLTEKFKLKPFVGARGLIFNQYFTTKSFTNTYNLSFVTTPPFDYSQIKQINNSNAIGAIFGIDNTLNFGKGFSLVFMGDFFVGYGKNNSYFWNFSNIRGVQAASDYIFEKSNSMKSMLDLGAGLSWKQGLFKGALDLMFSASYELHYIFQNPTFLYINPASDGTDQATSFQDMSKSCGFQGLTVRGGIGF